MTPPKLCGDCGTQMEVNPDLFALPGLDITESGLQFTLGRALPVTVYICPNCGRFKFMSAMMLGNLEPPKPQVAAPQTPQVLAEAAPEESYPKGSPSKGE